MNNPRIAYSPCRDASPEVESRALSNAYRFIVDCHHKKMAAGRIPEPNVRDDVATVRNMKEVTV